MREQERRRVRQGEKRGKFYSGRKGHGVKKEKGGAVEDGDGDVQ